LQSAIKIPTIEKILSISIWPIRMSKIYIANIVVVGNLYITIVGNVVEFFFVDTCKKYKTNAKNGLLLES
jgi:hypothetical protein